MQTNNPRVSLCARENDVALSPRAFYLRTVELNRRESERKAYLRFLRDETLLHREGIPFRRDTIARGLQLSPRYF
jgi:hypothetical protein